MPVLSAMDAVICDLVSAFAIGRRANLLIVADASKNSQTAQKFSKNFLCLTGLLHECIKHGVSRFMSNCLVRCVVCACSLVAFVLVFGCSVTTTKRLVLPASSTV